MTTLTKDQAVAKIKSRIKSIELMRKHNFLTANSATTDKEYKTLKDVCSFISFGGSFYTVKGILHCIKGSVAIPF